MEDDQEKEIPLSEGEARREASDEMIVECLAAGMTYEEAGTLGGVTDRTVGRRMTDPEFAARVQRRRRDRVTRVSDQLTALSETAISTLLDVMVIGKAAERLKAAEVVLAMTLRFRLQHALNVEIDELDVPTSSTPAVPRTGVES